jgi:putative alpha-1,2-mannosidase
VMGNGKKLEVIARKNSTRNMYIQSATLNGKRWNKPWFSQADIRDGGVVVLNMGPDPNAIWGSSPDAAPSSMTSATQ